MIDAITIYLAIGAFLYLYMTVVRFFTNYSIRNRYSFFQTMFLVTLYPLSIYAVFTDKFSYGQQSFIHGLVVGAVTMSFIFIVILYAK